METEIRDLHIRSAEARDFETVNRLCTLCFGGGYLKRADFDRWLSHPELFLVLECGAEFAGYVVFVPESPAELSASLRLPPEEVAAASGGNPVIHCRSTAIFPAYEHSGLMRRLWVQILENVRAGGYRVAYGPAWKYNGFVPMDHLLTAFGFVPLYERENLWYDDETYTCIVCGGRCTCPAVIYQLAL